MTIAAHIACPNCVNGKYRANDMTGKARWYTCDDCEGTGRLYASDIGKVVAWGKKTAAEIAEISAEIAEMTAMRNGDIPHEYNGTIETADGLAWGRLPDAEAFKIIDGQIENYTISLRAETRRLEILRAGCVALNREAKRAA